MSRNMNWKTWVILGLVVAVVVASGSLVMASNMGFKINKALKNGYVAANAPIGNNWISLPYNNPYASAKDFCNAIPTTSAGATVSQLDGTTGAYTSFKCNAAATFPPAGTNFNLNPLKGVLFTATGSVITGVVMVGSSNETSTITLLDAYVANNAPVKVNWISAPYHMTWVTANDICVTLGSVSAAYTISRLDAVTGAYTSHKCNAGVPGFSLVMGESIQITKTGTTPAQVAWFPPHF